MTYCINNLRTSSLHLQTSTLAFLVLAPTAVAALLVLVETPIRARAPLDSLEIIATTKSLPAMQTLAQSTQKTAATLTHIPSSSATAPLELLE
jgi:hypothetical protein